MTVANQAQPAPCTAATCSAVNSPMIVETAAGRAARTAASWSENDGPVPPAGAGVPPRLSR
nr:hypothetical protein [Pseudonocardia sp. ICBG162]